MTSLPVRCLAPTGDRCGEAPVWSEAEGAVYWTDINRFLIHRLDAEGAVRSWFFDEPVVALSLTARAGTLAVALGSRLVWWEPAVDIRRDHGFRLPEWPAARLNEGRADPRGSFWLGSMRNNVAPDGSPREAGGSDGVLYRIDPDGSVSEWQRGIGIANTAAWSPDGTRFYTADTLANAIYVYDYDASTGAIASRRPFFVDHPRGLPDGSSVDAEGYLWNCRWNGASILRIAPDGSLDRVVEMPSRHITSCTFGGAELRTLIVTSAALGAPAGDRLAGSLFAVETGVRGIEERKFL